MWPAGTPADPHWTVSTSVATAPVRTRRGRRIARHRPVQATEQARVPARGPACPDVDALAVRWQRAFDAADRALAAAAVSLCAAELRQRRRALAAERAETARALASLARASYATYVVKPRKPG